MAKDVLVEIGLEELPARFVIDAENQLLEKTKNWLSDSRIAYTSIQSFSTPRRLAVQIQDVAEEQTSLEKEVKGPALKIAQDDEGKWTKAATGFSKGQGKTVEDLYTKDVKGIPYVFVEKQIIGQPTEKLLPQFRDILTSIPFPQTMRWADHTLHYARPIRWLTALFGRDVIPFSITGVETSARTYGHRFLGNTITLTSPDEYEEALEKQYVIPDPNKRQQMIVSGLKQAETTHGFNIPEDYTLLQEVCNLVEYPTVFIGSFASSYLTLPPEVLMTSMKEHQRYFPVKSGHGELLPYFAGVRNGDDDALDTVIKGNERVLKSRLSDAQFFFEEDQRQSIDYYLQKLDRIVFQEKLGTIGDKVKRITAITDMLSQWLDYDDTTRANAIRTAQICKFDLPTNMVDEFSNLQGIMGETYALNAGEKRDVARAIAEHYLPDKADGKLPETVEGALVSVADKLDTVVGCISAGLIPSGSEDPYGLRRQATGMLKIVQTYNWPVAMESLLALAKQQYSQTDLTQDDSEKAGAAINQFINDRAMHLLKALSLESDVIQAVLAYRIGNMAYVTAKAKILSYQRNNPDFKSAQEALVRVLKLAAKAEQTDVDQTAFVTDSEQQLYDTYLAVKTDYDEANRARNASLALQQLARLAEPIHAFFDHNMVMTDDEAIRTNRLALLGQIASLIDDFADLSVIEWKQHH